jgi:protein-S-isoprenylcysteine O-methyltransferase Ste14
VRHPGYLAALVVFVGTALAIGSFRALAPTAISSALMIPRTHWEDGTLQAELPGYKDYARRECDGGWFPAFGKTMSGCEGCAGWVAS